MALASNAFVFKEVCLVSRVIAKHLPYTLCVIMTATPKTCSINELNGFPTTLSISVSAIFNGLFQNMVKE